MSPSDLLSKKCEKKFFREKDLMYVMHSALHKTKNIRERINKNKIFNYLILVDLTGIPVQNNNNNKNDNNNKFSVFS